MYVHISPIFNVLSTKIRPQLGDKEENPLWVGGLKNRTIQKQKDKITDRPYVPSKWLLPRTRYTAAQPCSLHQETRLNSSSGRKFVFW